MDFNNELAAWYNANKRDLPWRNTADPYIIWLSEIILQQTRVEQGLPYFYRFAGKYGDVNKLADASEDDVLKLWQGLGYYSRARNMLKTARTVKEHLNGKFPSNYSTLIKLKGIGEYTAAAISSFAANEQKAVVDGNVYRVLARYFGIDEPVNSTVGKKKFQQTADQILNRTHPGLHNQAMMELGAMVCKPKNPACGICPVRSGCYAFLHNAINVLPVKLKKLKVRERYLNYFLITEGDTLLMNKRDESDIWANMYDLPLIETDTMFSAEDLLDLPIVKQTFGDVLNLKEIWPVKTHLLTHQKLLIRFVIFQDKPLVYNNKWFFTHIDDLNILAMPKMIFIFLKKFFNL